MADGLAVGVVWPWAAVSFPSVGPPTRFLVGGLQAVLGVTYPTNGHAIGVGSFRGSGNPSTVLPPSRKYLLLPLIQG